jgi:hypothetical protein
MGEDISSPTMTRRISMTTAEERYRAIKQSRKMLEELCDPGKTPRVPSIVRDKARTILRHFPNDFDIDRLAETSPEMLEKKSNNDKLLKIAR